MDTKQERVLSFFDAEIGQFILGDLDVLAHIRPHPNSQLGGCTVPQAMVIFASADALSTTYAKRWATNLAAQTGK